jgi:hypothetical protein
VTRYLPYAMGRRSLLLATAWLAAVVAAACPTTQLEPTATLEEAVRVYRLSKDPKAMAIASDEYGQRAWGVFYGGLRQERATEEALAACERNAARAGVRAPCYLFAIGDQPAQQTVRACAEGRIGPRRCAVQSRYGW